jgi:hypothetical protein
MNIHPTLKIVLAIIAGLLGGSAVNMGLIMLGGELIPPPLGADVSSMVGLNATMHLFQTKHYIFPFLAHAVGTLAGATLASYIMKKHELKLAMAIGLAFFIAGFINVISLPAPMWFNILDLGIAYIPMAWIGHKVYQTYL